jgi:hypothetical protein
MIDFIPLEYYTKFYYFIILFVVFIIFINSKVAYLQDRNNLKNLGLVGFLLLFFILIFMGLRPVSGKYFGDTLTYSYIFNDYKTGDLQGRDNVEFSFRILVEICSKIMGINGFFFVCALLYVLPLYYASRKIFNQYWFLAFIMLVTSMSFWSYGTNGIRNGLATSFFIYGLTKSTIKSQLIWFFIAFGFHKSVTLPILGYLLTLKFNTPRGFLIFWFSCIPFSLLIGSSFQDLISGAFEDERLNSYFYNTTQLKEFSKIGFRWDFLAYSSTGIFAGWYFIVKRKFQDKFYTKIYSIYVFANACWILVIKSAFSNRFAYLSWFMLGLIIVYPFLKQQFFKNQYAVLGTILGAYFTFTFILEVIIGYR